MEDQGLPVELSHKPLVNSSILGILEALGSPQKGIRQESTALTISQYFAKDRKEQSLTFGELYLQIMKMAQGYQALGLQAGSKIALAENNSLDFFSTYFGGLAMGAIMVPINLLALQDESTKTRRLMHMLATPTLSSTDSPGVDAYVYGEDPMFAKMAGLAKILKIKKSPMLTQWLLPVAERFAQGTPSGVLDPILFKLLEKNAPTPREKRDFLTLLQQLPPKLKLISPELKKSLMEKDQPDTPDFWKHTPIAPDQIADILFTSGTSGNPKGVALTHQNLSFTVESLTEGTEDVICDGDTVLMGLPFFHIFGKAVMLAAFSRQLAIAGRGGEVKVVILPSLSKAVQNLDGILKTIETYQITLLPAVPIFFEKLLDYLRLHPHKQPMIASLTKIISGGAALKKETYDGLKAIHPSLWILEGYGSSEGGINLLNKAGTCGSVGQPLPGVSVKIFPPHSSLEGKGEFEQGLQNPGDGEESSTPQGFVQEYGELFVRSEGASKGYVQGTTSSKDLSLQDEDGWFHTGDIVSFDSETASYKIKGRESFFIKIDNEKRAPGELEEAVHLVSPTIKEVIVVPYQAGSMQEKSVALVLTPDRSLTEESIKKSMRQLVQRNLISRWKIPKHLILVYREKLPTQFENEFKREAVYKVVREFILNLLALKDANNQPVVIFHEKSETRKFDETEISDKNQVETLLSQYDSIS